MRTGDKLVRTIKLDGKVLTLNVEPTRYWMSGQLSVVTIVWEKLA